MMYEDINRLAQRLIETGNVLNRQLGKSIEKQNTKDTFDPVRDGKVRDKINKKLYKLFISSIDKNSKQELLQLKNTEKQLTELIESSTGWFVSRTGAVKYDNFQYQDDPEFATHDTYTVPRDAMGFHVDEDEPFNSYFAGIRSGEQSFYENNKETLDKLNAVYREQERIMLGAYNLENPDISFETMRMIAEYLGYEDLSLKMGNRLF